jgi:hypothetical protein
MPMYFEVVISADLIQPGDQSGWICGEQAAGARDVRGGHRGAGDLAEAEMPLFAGLARARNPVPGC